jgi:hypothetical protein
MKKRFVVVEDEVGCLPKKLWRRWSQAQPDEDEAQFGAQLSRTRPVNFSP